MNAASIFSMNPVWMALSACAAVIFIFAMIDAATGQRWRRGRFGRRLKLLRLEQLLKVFGIDREYYLQAQPILALHEQLSTCRRCPHEVACQAHLARAGSKANFMFCPNRAALLRLKMVLPPSK